MSHRRHRHPNVCNRSCRKRPSTDFKAFDWTATPGKEGCLRKCMLSQIVHVHRLWLKIRHTRHRTGVHTDAVTTSSGTPHPWTPY